MSQKTIIGRKARGERVSIGVNEVPVISLGDAMSRVSTLDLDFVHKIATQDALEYMGEIDEIKRQYRRFLTMAALHPDRPLVPTRKIERMWCLHILWSRGYSDDCESLFGCYFYHVPILDNDKVGRKILSQAYDETAALYRRLFNSSYGSVISCDSGCCAEGPGCKFAARGRSIATFDYHFNMSPVEREMYAETH